eukprot:scaffold122346_cov90-Phaeocystis_antarctica.AAC.1
MRTRLAPTMGTAWGLTSRTRSSTCLSGLASSQGCVTSVCNATVSRTDRGLQNVCGHWHLARRFSCASTCRVALAVRSAPFGPRGEKFEP